jgi:hypothetical protein
VPFQDCVVDTQAADLSSFAWHNDLPSFFDFAKKVLKLAIISSKTAL